MPKITKQQKKVLEKYDFEKNYNLTEAIKIIKETSYTKFDASIDIAVNLGVQAEKAEQMVRGVAFLPHGTGKDPKVLVLCPQDKNKEAKDAGADYVGLDDYIIKIEKGWTDVDAIVTTPSLMAKVGKLGKVLGPRGLMPNPKTGTVTIDVGKAVKEIKSGKISFKTDKFGIVHARVGKVSFSEDKIKENTKELLDTLLRLKPSKAKGVYIKKIHLASTMGRGVSVGTSVVK